MRALRAPRMGRIAIGVAVALALALTSGAGAAQSGSGATANPFANAHVKPLCAGSRPARGEAPVAHCDAWAMAASTGKLIALARPSRAALRAAVATPSTTASPNTVQGIWPDQLNTAYSLPFATAGSATQTVGIVDAFDNPVIRSDLDQMDSDFGFGSFPTCGTVTTSCFEKVNQTGGSTPPACSGTADDCDGWAFETALDVETVHTLCRDCKIILVEANSDSLDDLAAAVNEAAALGATVISNSYGAAEGTDPQHLQSGDFTTFAPAYRHSGIIVVASSGDDAYAGGTQFPADVNDVVAVGGTTLSTNSSSNGYVGESVWYAPSPTPASGAGSGCSMFETPKTWQSSAPGWTASGCASHRGVADVSADADPNSGFRIYNAMDCTPPVCYWQFGGTSLAAPIIAATYALAANPGTVSRPESLPYAHFRDLHDVISGSNGSCASTICKAAVGYDGPTGMGSPNGLLGFSIGIPSVGTISPLGGPAGTTVTLNGQDLSQASAVTVGGTPVQSFDVVSDIKITAVVGAGTSGPIRVTTPGGVATSPAQFQFTPTITSFTPRGGGTGTSVVITGTGFGGASAVKFDGTDASSFTVDSDTQITATTAAGTNTGPVSVTGTGGTGTSSTPFYGPPSISSLSPTSGGEHSTVTVTGTNLTGASSVKLSGHTASFSVVSPTQITFVAPTGATTGTVQVTTPGGIATSGSFTVLGPPTITSFTPGSGPVGTPVTITGTNLGDVVGVSIGTTITVPTSVSPTQVVFSIPPGAATGAIRLLARNGSVTSLATFTVTS
jgi:hypothetical protein